MIFEEIRRKIIGGKAVYAPLDGEGVFTRRHRRGALGVQFIYNLTTGIQ